MASSVNVAQLRKAIADLPDDMPVVLDHEIGIDADVNLLIIPANRDRRWDWSMSEGHVNLDHEIYRRAENIHVLHISTGGLYGDDAGQDITPSIPRRTVDGEIAPLEITP
ncbi:MAG: hypothetical protein ABFE07_12770 [Armatimonadia bacterium]